VRICLDAGFEILRSLIKPSVEKICHSPVVIDVIKGLNLKSFGETMQCFLKGGSIFVLLEFQIMGSGVIVMRVCQCISGPFGAGEYSSAIILYEAANNLRKLNSHAAKTTNRGTSWEYWINLVRKREKLGKIRPEKIHRILAFYIDKTDVEFESASGKIL